MVNLFLKKIFNKENISLFEPLVLFSVFFLPGYLSQNLQNIDFTMFNSAFFNLFYIATTIPQIILTIYIIILKPGRNLKDFSIGRFHFKDVFKAIIIFVGIYFCVLIVGLFSFFFDIDSDNSLIFNAKWEFNSPELLPLIFISCIVTGYYEEIFFRSYLFTYLKQAGTPVFIAILSVSILFGIGHIYEGYFAFAATSLIGFFLSIAFIKSKSIHAIAIAHGMYNFSILLFIMIEVFV